MKKLIVLIAFIIPLCAFSQDNNYEWDDYFMPGIGYKAYAPNSYDSLGIYQGIVTEFVFYSRARGKDSYYSGPARIKAYGSLAMLTSEKTTNKLFYMNLGTNLSFESSTNRSYFLPYFGLEFGGMFQKDLNIFHITPLLGVQLISTRTIIWSIQGGYQYSTKMFDYYSGLTASSSINFLLWKD